LPVVPESSDTMPSPSPLPVGNFRSSRRLFHGEGLLFSNDPRLQETRAMLVESAGFRCRTLPGAVLPCSLQGTQFVIVVLCHTIAHEQAAAMAEMLYARMPFTPILRLSRAGRAECGYFDRLVVSPSPGELLGEIRRLSVLGILRRMRHLAECQGVISQATAARPVEVQAGDGVMGHTMA
jgi:hypothetical protein